MYFFRTALVFPHRCFSFLHLLHSGILLLDHIGLDEMENDVMKQLERDGHGERMSRAYARTIVADRPSVIDKSRCRPLLADARNQSPISDLRTTPADARNESISTQSILLYDSVPMECDQECKNRKRQRVEERRALVRQSRTTTSRQDLLELSKQRAALYNTTYQGTKCIQGVPCI